MGLEDSVGSQVKQWCLFWVTGLGQGALRLHTAAVLRVIKPGKVPVWEEAPTPKNYRGHLLCLVRKGERDSLESLRPKLVDMG